MYKLCELISTVPVTGKRKRGIKGGDIETVSSTLVD